MSFHIYIYVQEAVQSAIPTDVCSPSVDRIAFDTTIVTTAPSAIATATSTTNTTPSSYQVSYNDNETSYSKSYSFSSSSSALFKTDSFSDMGYSQQLRFIVEHKNDLVDLSIENTKTVGK